MSTPDQPVLADLTISLIPQSDPLLVRSHGQWDPPVPKPRPSPWSPRPGSGSQTVTLGCGGRSGLGRSIGHTDP
jgi:hypothetical protein